MLVINSLNSLFRRPWQGAEEPDHFDGPGREGGAAENLEEQEVKLISAGNHRV